MSRLNSLTLLIGMAHLTAAQNVIQPRQGDLERPMQIVRPGRGARKPAVEAFHEARQIRIGSHDRRDPLELQFLDQAILQRAVGPFDPVLGLG